jgi:hypothetical protein
MNREQQCQSVSQFQSTENYSNEHCGKSKYISDGEDISTVTNHKFSVVLITNGSYTNEETREE